MKKDLSITKRYCVICIMAVVLIIAFLLAVLPVNANAETTEITSNEEVYKELTDDDQLSGLDVTLDDYINNMKSEYYNIIKRQAQAIHISVSMNIPIT